MTSAQFHRRQVLYLGACFCILFTAYNSGQSLMTALHSGVGFWSLALLYLTFGVSNLFAPTLRDATGESLRPGLAISAAAYVTFTFAVAFDFDWALLLSSALVGVAASLLWLSQGIYLSRVALASGQPVGQFTGLFFSIYSGNTGISHTIALTLLSSGISSTVFLVSMGCLGCIRRVAEALRNLSACSCSVAMMLFLTDYPPKQQDTGTLKERFGVLFAARRLIATRLQSMECVQHRTNGQNAAAAVLLPLPRFVRCQLRGSAEHLRQDCRARSRLVRLHGALASVCCNAEL